MAKYYFTKADHEALGGCAFVFFLGFLAFWGTVVWIVVHFISKFW